MTRSAIEAALVLTCLGLFANTNFAPKPAAASPSPPDHSAELAALKEQVAALEAGRAADNAAWQKRESEWNAIKDRDLAELTRLRAATHISDNNGPPQPAVVAFPVAGACVGNACAVRRTYSQPVYQRRGLFGRRR